MAFFDRTQKMGLAAMIMGGSILISRFLGLIRDKVISFLFGATQESDIYFAAFVIPDFINYLLAGAYFSITLIPLLADYFDRDPDDGWRFFSTVFTWIALVMVVLTILAVGFSDKLAHLAAPGLGEAERDRLALFLRIIMPAQICFLLGSCFTAILFLRKQFVIPAFIPLVYNFFIILMGILLHKRGMVGFCWGVLFGAFLGFFLMPLFAVRKGGGLKLQFSLYHHGLKKFLMLSLPLMLGQSIVVLDEQLMRVFGSLAGTGAISWLSYARRVMLVPVGVIAQAAGVASYPFLAELVSKKDYSGFHQTVNSALRSVLTLLIPISVWMIAIAEPTIRIIFQQGNFGPSDTSHTTHLLQILLIVVSCWGFQQVLGRAYYANLDTFTPAVVGTLCSVVSIGFYFILTKHLHALGVAMASAVSIFMYTVLLAFWWLHRFGKAAFSGLGGDVAKLIALSIISWIPGSFIMHFEIIDSKTHIYLSALYAIGVGSLSFFMVFGFLAFYFIRPLVQPFIKRFGLMGRWLNR